MVESLVITLREGVEAALVVGIILAYLRKIGRGDLNRHVYAAVGAAVLASLVLAGVFQAIGFDPENEYLEGALFGVAGFFVLSMVVWMWRTARGLRREMEGRLETITVLSGGTGRVGSGLFAFAFLMVLREGVETILFLEAAALGEEQGLLSVVGGILGLGLAALFAVLFVRGSLRIDLARFFRVTGFALVVLAAKLLAQSAHELGEVRLLPLTREVMAVLGYLVRDDTGALIITALVAVPIFLLLWESFRRPAATALVEGESGPARRKRLAAARLERTWQLGLGGTAALVVLALGSTAVAGARLVDPAPEPVSANGSAVRVPMSHMEEGHLHKFAYSTTGATPVRFLLARLPDGSIASGLDACQICGSVGYGQEGAVAICKNCNAPIPFDSFTFGGGCNPLPLAVEIDGDDVVVSVAELEAAAKSFQ